MKKYLLLTLCLTCLLASAQKVSIDAYIDTNRIMIGEQIRVFFQASVPKGSEFQWPVFPDTTAGLELVRESIGDTLLKDDQWKLQMEWYITSFDSGYFAIPPLNFQSKSGNAQTQAMAIEVVFPNVDKQQDYFDIKKPLEVERNWWLISLVILIIILIITLFIYFIYFFRKEKRDKFSETAKALPPAEFALKQLQELEKEKAWEAEDQKSYYSQLIDILRLYLKRRYGISTLESTADEMIDQLRELSLNPELFEQSREILQLSVLVKYARTRTAPEKGRQALESIRRFIIETRPQNPEEND